MKIVIGLGNPGARYESTRHNVGWMVLDAVAARLRTSFRAGPGEYAEASGRWRGSDLLLVKPSTFMNNSGIAARQLADRHSIPPSEMLVVVDEFQFPVGRIRLKPSGSSGGHNGLESLIYHLETDRFPRLRCGIGDDFERGGLVEHVLSPFPVDEVPLVEEMVERAKDLVLMWLAEGTERAMSLFKRTEPPTEAPAEEPSTDQRETDNTAAD